MTPSKHTFTPGDIVELSDAFKKINKRNKIFDNTFEVIKLKGTETVFIRRIGRKTSEPFNYKLLKLKE